MLRARVMNAVRKAKEECTHNVGGLVEFFKVECAHFFHSLWAASKGTGAGQILYIFRPPNLDVPQGKDLPAEWLDDDGKAKYTFFGGTEPGSLVDLVTGKHGTTFPRNCSDDGKTLHGRTRRSSSKKSSE